ncbi:DExH-box ATP-dependent RNA helicase DExH5, mitochondrial isoform X2 [Durio zibethinus]|uniref:RNA helicase n=1 Tax=Durio zibethinus TaxID=66656 RepID=A0A6P6BFN0_DURZI|nr:DExH-box ATP-dependent RNA helicase DExH5, mitochondrial isoform X2 [Durio zibethinus]
MKDRPPSSCCAVYIPPHHRFRSVVFSPNSSNSSKNGADFPTSAASVIHSKLLDRQNIPVLNAKGTAAPPPLSYLQHDEKQQQRQRTYNSNNGNKNSNNQSSQYNSAYCHGISKNGSDRQMDLSLQSGTFGEANVDEWKRKLVILLHDDGKQELVSREKKDRRYFEQIAALASRMGLYSHLYSKVAVFSKAPLPNYRFDLDDKRPQREVNLNFGLLKRVDAHLGEYLSKKSRTKESFSDNCFSKSSSNSSIVTDEGLFEQPEPMASNTAIMEKILWRRSLQLHAQQQAWQESLEGRGILEFRQSLPAYKEKDAILTAILQNQVLIISGETGCGKTTQIPQFILESEIDFVRGAVCNIICTQPRRISAMSVSERVASERGEKLGESVGYKVRLEGMRGKETRLLFCTTGILLRRLLIDRNLKGVTHIIVDEIHERGINEDFLLIVLKDLLPRRPELKLILMSASLDAELFSSYFGGAPLIHIPGFTHPVRIHFLENILEMMGYRLTPYNQIDDYGQERMWKMSKQAPRKRKSQIASAVEDALRAADFKDFSPQTWESLSCWNPDCIGFNLIEYLLSYICENERPGAVLVFVTGWDDISSLKDKLQSHPILGDPNRVSLLTCHGFLASSEQKLIFEEPKDGVRKIVLTTNIAETSITINDVVFVLDCGKAKETSYDALNNTPCLLPSWISKVSAQQRRGRAGRVEPGECYHLYPRCVYDAFAEYQLPEILRTPLQSLCLQIKSLKLESISEFLSRALQSPELLAVQNAVEYLKIIGALDESENLTILGRYLTMLPMEPKLGKMLILGAILNCLDPVLTVVAGLSVRDPFLTPLDKKDLAETAKLQFSRDYSDHLALVRAYEGWKEAEKDLAGYDYCWKNFLSAQSMKAIDSLRVEFLSLLKGTGLIDGNATSCNTWSYDQHLIRAIICYGLYPGICSVVHNEKSFSLKTMEDGPVLLYSNSVNARESRIPYPWLVFNEKIKVNSIFLRDSTAVSDSVLLLFGGSISRGNVDGHLKMLGGYLEFFMQPAIAEKFQSLRREFDELIQNKLLNPQMVLHFHHELISAVRLLVSEDQCDGRFVFGRQDLKPSTMPVMPPQPTLVSRTESGPGGDNSKSQLQTLLTRAGYAAPTYKTKQLKNNQFRATVEFNGMQIMGQPWNNKKSAEKDAAAEALKWLIGGTKTGHDYFNHMSMLLKKSKRDH